MCAHDVDDYDEDHNAANKRAAELMPSVRRADGERNRKQSCQTEQQDEVHFSQWSCKRPFQSKLSGNKETQRNQSYD